MSENCPTDIDPETGLPRTGQCNEERAAMRLEVAEAWRLANFRERERDEAIADAERMRGLIAQEQNAHAQKAGQIQTLENELRGLRASVRDERRRAMDDAKAIVKKGGDLEAELEAAKEPPPKPPPPGRPLT